MGATELTPDERKFILVLHDAGLKLSAISEATYRSIGFKEVRAEPELLPRHQMARKKWGDDHEDKTNAERAAMLFSDEKKWNLDGLDGLQRRWIDMRRPDPVVVRRHSGGGSVVV
ncbi:hypothetical protein BBP00_00002454 [Phytophthora kernoviae]|uniref:Uncharacterized protein n=1 Tax=Phytophthora kernoviae TaxID=325452 RepID=A0A3F2RXH6_9STRA|nr:hypothetical protein BBP00_00002454 [Phytophthora kernoviae]